MFQAPKTVPDTLTYLRILVVPVLWVFALTRRDTALGIGFFAAGLTDVLDGYLARKSGKSTRLGSQLDSVADLLLIVSVVVWLLMLRPGFIRQEITPIVVWLLVGGAAMLVGWLKFRRVANLHLYSAKAAGVLGYLFATHLLLQRDYNRVLFYVTIVASIAAALEALVVQLLRDRVDEHTGSLFARPR